MQGYNDNSMDAAEEQRIAILDALGLSLASKRREAVAARAASGIEDEWEEDESFYQGYDDANRSEFVNTASKPLANGSTSEVKTDVKGSTVFPNITQPYVDAVSARIGDMLLPTDDRNFAVEATPIPDMGLDQFPDEATPPPAQPEIATEVPQQPSNPMLQMPNGSVVPVQEAKAAFAKMKAEASRKAGKAEQRIDDWLTECQSNAEMRKVIDDAVKSGSGVIKGPVPVNRKSSKWQRGDDGIATLTIIEEIKPASFRVDPWNLFPDPACGESIHNGAYIFERDFLTGKKIQALRGLPGYIDDQIEKCLEEGPKSLAESDGKAALYNRSTKDQFEIWYIYVDMKAEELAAAGCDCGDDKKSFPAILTMVNDRVIRASLNPMDSGEFPYDVIPFKRRPGMPWGMGLARQLRTPQRIVVGATRRLMDNAGLGSGPQIVVRRGVEPENGVWEIAPLKIWVESEDSDGQATLPVTSVVIPMLQAELTNIIQFGMKMAEDVTGMPMLLQGQQGKAPDTVGGMTILNNNANAVLRRVARLFDSSITEPHIRRYYAWLMEYGEDEDEKGDFQIVARGSTALIERDLQSQEMVNVLALCLNPAYKKNPAKAMDEYLKSRRFDPAAFDYTEEELAQIQSQQPQPPPQIEVAKIRADADLAKTDKQLAAKAQETQMTLQAEAQGNEADRQLRQWEIQAQAQLEAAALTAEERKALNDAKVTLSGIAMKLRTQKELSAVGMSIDMHKHNNPQSIAPPTEPAGRAQPGQAFQQ